MKRLKNISFLLDKNCPIKMGVGCREYKVVIDKLLKTLYMYKAISALTFANV